MSEQSTIIPVSKHSIFSDEADDDFILFLKFSCQLASDWPSHGSVHTHDSVLHQAHGGGDWWIMERV